MNELPDSWSNACAKELQEGLSPQEWDALKRRSSKNGQTVCEKYGISMADVMPELTTGRKIESGYLLKHPIHGATGDGNLSVNTSKNLWHCFRCESGGDPITWIAVREGFIDCADAGPLDKETFKRCKKVAERDGFVRDESDKGGLTVDGRPSMLRQNENDATDDLEILSPAELRYDGTLFEQLCETKEHKDGSVTVRPLPGKIATYLLQQCRFLTIEETDDVHYYDPDSKLYHKDGEKQIGNAMEVLIGDPLSTKHVSETVDHIRRRTRLPRSECLAPPTLIPTLDGVYDLTTETIIPYSPDVPFFDKHDFSYDLAVLGRDTRAKRLIHSSFAREDIVSILEMGGRCLYRAPLYKKAFMLLGDGDNGKSIFLTWLTKTVGKQNVSSLSLYQLIKSRFGTAMLDGMNANIYADIGGGDLVYVGMFMAVTGGDAIAVEHKGKPLYMIVPYAVQVYSTNKLPNVKDPPDQFYNRWILIEMPYTFVDDPQEPYERQRDASFEIDEPSDEDKSWLGTAFIEALKILLKNGHFTESESGKNVKERWITKTDSLRTFVNEMVEVSPGSRVTKKEFMESYQAWCGDAAMNAYSERYVGIHLPRYVHTRTVHTSPRSWSNISVKGLNPLEMPQSAEADLMRYDLSNEGVDDD
jgi:P4 family phage/plasmid primase-like protien